MTGTIYICRHTCHTLVVVSERPPRHLHPPFSSFMSVPNEIDFAVTNAQDKLNDIVKEDEAKHRVAVHTFDPDASPQEKGASAGKARDKVKSVAARDQDGPGAKGLSVLSSLSVVAHS